MLDGPGRNAETAFAAESLAAELEQDPVKFRLFDDGHNTGSGLRIAETFTSRRPIRQTKAMAKKIDGADPLLPCRCAILFGVPPEGGQTLLPIRTVPPSGTELRTGEYVQ